jgi:bifunctional UDP-N-acetylglucosamine pyrophosphorylase / glucosamine-1-phosphate N-acetyltransferase
MGVTGIILAGGKGKRFGAVGRNKTSEIYQEKPLVVYGVELFRQVADTVVVVVGEYANSVKSALENYPDLIFAVQKRRLGTGNALKAAVREMQNRKIKPEIILLGYADHMMHYRTQTADNLVRSVKIPGTAVAMVVTRHSDPNRLAYGRVLRDNAGNISGIVEQKDASPEQQQINELNAGLYAFNYGFVRKWVGKIKKSRISGEYYATDLIEMAINNGWRVEGVDVSFSEVGYGITTPEDLRKTNESLLEE